jgi:hypothetical protein
MELPLPTGRQASPLFIRGGFVSSSSYEEEVALAVGE